MKLAAWCDEERGRTAALCRVLKVASPFVCRIKAGQAEVPVRHAPRIEAHTGGAVTRRELRPHDWWELWPELVTPEHPAPIASIVTEQAQA